MDDDLDTLLNLIGQNNATALERIERAQWVIRTAEDDMRTAVREAHASGDSWTKIGAALGMTRQAAHERFGRGPDIEL